MVITFEAVPGGLTAIRHSLPLKKVFFRGRGEKHNTLQDKIRQKERDTKRLNTDADELRQVLDHAKGEFAEATRAKDDAAEAYSQAKGVFEDASKKHADADLQLQALRLRMDNADRTWAVHADLDAQANVAEQKSEHSTKFFTASKGLLTRFTKHVLLVRHTVRQMVGNTQMVQQISSFLFEKTQKNNVPPTEKKKVLPGRHPQKTGVRFGELFSEHKHQKGGD